MSAVRKINLWHDVSKKDWTDWRWQFRNRLASVEDIQKIILLTENEIKGFCGQGFAVGITPYFLSLIDPTDVNCPIRRQAILNLM